MPNARSDKTVPRVLIGAPASSTGKTTVACALLRALQRRGLDLRACKCGPDYIDPLFHTQVIGVPSRNIDLFFADAPLARTLLAQHGAGADLVLIEGAMGYFDGISTSDTASAWDTARITDTPAVLVVDARGRARSLAAEVAGFARFREPSMVGGVILNRLSPGMFARMKELVESETGVPVLGYMPALPDCAFESRHLGLVTAPEVLDLNEKLDKLADAAERGIDLDALIKLAQAAPPLDAADGKAADMPMAPRGVAVSGVASAGNAAKADGDIPALSKAHPSDAEEEASAHAPSDAATQADARKRIADAAAPNVCALQHAANMHASQRTASAQMPAASLPPRIAVAKDAAFCFYYADTLDQLASLGAEIVEFSPLADGALPAGTCALYLGGGYPELHAQALSRNTSMLASVKSALAAGMPAIAECGGFLYLHDTLRTEDGSAYPLAGVIHAEAFPTRKLGRFGYVTLTAHEDSLLAARGDQLRAHEFHYWDSTAPGSAFTACKPLSSRSWECAHAASALYAGFPHLYLPAHPQAAARFVAAAAAFATRGNCEICAAGASTDELAASGAAPALASSSQEAPCC